jgi:hypothetical protein
MPSTRAGTMNVKQLSVTISSNGSDIVVLPPRPITPFPGGYNSLASSPSSVYDEDGDSVMTSENESDDSGSEYCPTVILADTPAPLRYTRTCRAAITSRQAAEICKMHSLSLYDMKCNLWNTVPHVRFIGSSPADLSPAPTAPPTIPQTPLEPAFGEVFDDHQLLTVADRTPTPAGSYDDFFASLYQTYLTHDVEEGAELSARQPTPDAVTDAYVFGQGSPPAPPVPVQDDTDFDAFVANELASETWIDPYALPDNACDRHMPVCNVLLDSETYHFALHTLANSGVNFLTDYPLSTSPRVRPGQIRHALQKWNLGRCSDPIIVGEQLEWPTRLYQVSTRDNLFVPFSYTNLWQPRTEISRASEGEPMSPKTVARRGFI